MSLSSPRPSDTEVSQFDQVRVNDSPPIPIPTTQHNNPITLGYLMTPRSKSDIFKLYQVLDLHAVINFPHEPIKLTTITKAQKSSHLCKAMCED